MPPFSWIDAGQVPPKVSDELTFTAVICRLTGEPIAQVDDWIGMKIDRQLNVPMSVEMTMDMDSPFYKSFTPLQLPRLKVYRTPTVAELVANPSAVRQLVFYGDLPETSVDEDGVAGQGKFIFQDPRWHMQDFYTRSDLNVYYQHNGIEYTVLNIVNNHIDTPYGTLVGTGQSNKGPGMRWFFSQSAFFPNWTGFSDTQDYYVEGGRNLAEVLDECTKLPGNIDIDFVPFDYYKSFGITALPNWAGQAMGNMSGRRGGQGSNRTEVHFFAGEPLGTSVGGLPANCDGMKRIWTKVQNSVTEMGTDQATGVQLTTRYNSAFTGLNPYGVRELYVAAKSGSVISSGALFDNAVQRVVATRQTNPIISIVNANREAPQPWLDYDIGDTVYTTSRRKGFTWYEIATRVHGFSIMQAPDGDLKTTIVATGPSDS